MFALLLDDRSIQLQMMLKYFEILEVIESTMEEQHRSKLDRRLKMSHLRIDTASDDIAALLMEADPRSLFLVIKEWATSHNLVL